MTTATLPSSRQGNESWLLLATAIIWGTSYGASKICLAYLPVPGLIALRFLLTFLILLPFWLRLPRQQQMQTLKLGWPVGVGLFLILMSEVGGVALTSASRAAFLISLCVMFTLPVEWLWMQKPAHANHWWAAVLALIGTWFLTGGLNGSWNRGDSLMLLAAVLRAIQGCLMTWQTRGKSVDMLGLTAIQSLVVGAGALLVWCVQSPASVQLPISLHFWSVLLYLVLACTLFAFYAMNRALARTSPGKVALLLGSEPLWGALFATQALGEQLTMIAWLGGGLIMVSTWWASRSAN